MRLVSTLVLHFVLIPWALSAQAPRPSDECVVRMAKSPEVKRFFTSLLETVERLHHEPPERRESTNWTLSIYRSWLQEQNLDFAHIVNLDACLGGTRSDDCSVPWREFSLNYHVFLNDLQDFFICERPSAPQLAFVTPMVEELIRRGERLHRETDRQFFRVQLLRSVATAEREATNALIERQNLGRAPHLCALAQSEIESQAMAMFTVTALREGAAAPSLDQILSRLMPGLNELGCR